MESNWEQIDGIWTLTKMVVNNQLTGHRTEIENKNVKYNQGLKESLFTERSLRKGAP